MKRLNDWALVCCKRMIHPKLRPGPLNGPKRDVNAVWAHWECDKCKALARQYIGRVDTHKAGRMREKAL
jgi:hypothetical protein